MSDAAHSERSRESFRIVFIGSEALLSRRPLEALICRCEVVGIVACRGGKRGRGRTSRWRRLLRPLRRAMGRRTLASIARKHGIDFLEMSAQDDAETARWIAARRPDLGCVSAISRLLPASIFEIPAHGFINLHPSLLPKFRGPFPLLWHFLTFERRGGVTVHAVDAGEDTGAVFARRALDIEVGETIDRLTDRLASLGAGLLVEVVSEIAAGCATATPQPEGPAPPRARRLRRREQPVDWEGWPIEHLFHVLRGLHGWTLPPPKWAWLFRWEVRAFERGRCDLPPRSIGRDARGRFAAHAEGKIRLKRSLRFPLPRI